VGAATANGAGLRAAMQRKGLGGTMERVLADPALDDAALEAVRRYLVDVRDGGLAEQLSFASSDAVGELQVRNERSTRDAPARISVLRVSGPFRVDTARSTCRRGLLLAGQSACRLVLRALPRGAGTMNGVLEMQFAPSKGLEPRVRRTTLHMGT
jgi:hypothetical protein